MAGKSDISLTVELIPVTTSGDLQRKIDALTSGVNPNPIKISVQVDGGTDALSELTQISSKVNSLVNSKVIKLKFNDQKIRKNTEFLDSFISKLDTLNQKAAATTISFSGSSGQDVFSNMSNQIQSLTNEISGLKTNLESLKGVDLSQGQKVTPASNGALTNNITEITNRLDAINTAISNVTNSLGSIGNALNAAPVTSFTDSINTACDAINKLKDSLDQLNSGKVPKSKNNLTDADNYKKAKAIVKDYFDYLTKLNTTENDVFTDASGKFVSKSGNYKYLAEELNRTADAYQKLDTITKQLSSGHQSQIVDQQLESQRKYNLALEETANKQRAAASKTQQDLYNKQYKDSAKAIKDYYKALNSLASTDSDIELDTNGNYYSKGGMFDALASSINNAKQKYDALKTSMGQLPLDKQASLIEIENDALNKHNILLEKIRQKNKGDTFIMPNTKEYVDSLNKINSLYDQIQKNAKAWSAATNGKSRNAYKDYKDQLLSLSNLANKLASQQLTPQDFESKFNEISRKASSDAKKIISSGENRQSFFAGLGDMAKKFTSYFGVSRIIMTAVNSMKELVTASMEIEDSMAQLRIVTGASDAEMSSFFSKSTELAKELGKSIVDVTSSIETFSRLGYNLSDSSSLAKFANILSNVADVNVDTATTGLTSIIKGYGMDVSEAEHVSDVLVKVGQEYAISAEELMEAFERGGAAMYASGTSFEKTAALFAATNAALQNASTVGTMWKTKNCLCVWKLAHRTYLIAGKA